MFSFLSQVNQSEKKKSQSYNKHLSDSQIKKILFTFYSQEKEWYMFAFFVTCYKLLHDSSNIGAPR